MVDVLRATYSDLKTVKTRSVCQLVLELPIEQLTDVVSLLGAPIPGNEIWVAVARLVTDTGGQPPEQIPPPKHLSQIAGILCNEGAFNAWASEHGYNSGKDYIYDRCTVRSRRDLDTDTEAARRFRDMRADYDLWRRGVAA